MRHRIVLALIAFVPACIGSSGLIGLELAAEGGESSVGDGGESTGEDGGEAGDEGGMDCDADQEAPAVALASPENLTLGIAPDTMFSVALSDDCGVDEESLVVRVNGEVVEASAQTNDGLTLIQWQGEHALDERITVELGAADLAGNPLQSELDYRVWDIVEWFVFPDPECDEGCPGMAGPREADPDGPSDPLPDQTFLVGGALGMRSVLLVNAAPVPEPMGTRVVRAELELGSSTTSDIVRSLSCHQLTVGFDPEAVTWNERDPGNPWTEPGAMAVPEDHGALEVATVTWDGEIAEFEPVTGPLDGAVAQQWLEGVPTGLWCVGPGMPIAVLSEESNVPPRVRVFVGRPL